MSMAVTEDTPPDMLTGFMDLDVILPNGKTVKMSIHRKTPMMDLLVKVKTDHHISPGDHAVEAMGDRGVLPYKPSTPIGKLDAFIIKIVDKKATSQKKVQVPYSFPNMFRLLVNLPNNQFYVWRVSPNITLSEILNHVCTEKCLEVNKYELRNPKNPDQTLELRNTLGAYEIQELSLVSKASKKVGGLMSSADIMHVKNSKQRQNSVCDSSLSSGSISSRSTSPIPPQSNGTVPSRPPRRGQKKQAPPPPVRICSEVKGEEKRSGTAVISHSRDSSDSSGYHEASVLSESPTHSNTLERSQSSSSTGTLPRPGHLVTSKSIGNLSGGQSSAPKSHSTSTASVNSIGGSQKKRAAPQPPTDPTAPAMEEKLKSYTLPTSRAEERIKSNVPFAPSEGVSNADEAGDAKAKPHAAAEESITKVVNTVVDSSVESELSVDSTKVDVADSAKVVEVKASTEDKGQSVRKPVPKPRTTVPTTVSRSRMASSLLLVDKEAAVVVEENGTKDKAEETRPSETQSMVKSAPVMGDVDHNEATGPEPNLKCKNTDALPSASDYDDGGRTCKTTWSLGYSEDSGNVSAVDIEGELKDRTCNMLPPPTEFQDVVSTDEPKDCTKPSCVQTEEENRIPPCQPKEDTTLRAQRNSKFMYESTNLGLDDRTKEKSRSHTDLKAIDPCNTKNSVLSYSKSFSNGATSILDGNGLKLSAYEATGADKDVDREGTRHATEVLYRNNKNLEKSYSVECIRSAEREDGDNDRITSTAFPKPTCPVQKKLAKRWPSSTAALTRSNPDLAVNQLNPAGFTDFQLTRTFEEFLKEKKLADDLNMKSLNVIRNILPQINGFANTPKTFNPFENKRSALYDKDIKERVHIIEEQTTAKAATQNRTSIITNVCPAKKYSYHHPPAINFATWGERPKTRVLIKDEDYVTETKKPGAAPAPAAAPAPTPAAVQKPPVSKKPNPLQFKKPGVKSHYEMFSALPRKKELTSLTLVQMEDEERKRSKMVEAARDLHRVPVVCAVELKKEFRQRQQQQNEQQEEVPDSAATVTVVKPSPVPPPVKPPGQHSVSIYINGSAGERNGRVEESGATTCKPVPAPVFAPPKRFFVPTVKGFRTTPAPTYPVYNDHNNSSNNGDDSDDNNNFGKRNVRISPSLTRTSTNNYNPSKTGFKYQSFHSVDVSGIGKGSNSTSSSMSCGNMNGNQLISRKELSSSSSSSLPLSEIKNGVELKRQSLPLPSHSLSSLSSLSSSSSSSSLSPTKPEFVRVQLKPVQARQLGVKSGKSPESSLSSSSEKDSRGQLMEQIRKFNYATLNSSKMRSAQ